MKKVTSLGHNSIVQVFFLEQTSELQCILYVVPSILLQEYSKDMYRNVHAINAINIYCFMQLMQLIFTASSRTLLNETPFSLASV